MAAQPYYNVGTATLTVGSPSMVGQGTLWLGNARPGDTVFGRSGERNIVVNVVDNEHIDLLFPATIAQAALGYAVMYTPDDPFTQTLVRKLLQTIGESTLVALANIAAAPNKLPYLDGTSSAATVDFKAWARALLELTPAARKGIRFDGAGDPALIDITDKATALLALADEPAMRTFLSLVLQANATDTTAGRVLKVGSFGVGIPVALASGSNLNAVTTGGSYYVSAAINAPGSGYGWMYVNPYDASNASQVFVDVTSGTRYERIQISGTWSRWRTSASSIALSAPNLNTPRPAGNYYVSAAANAPGSTYGWWRVRDYPVNDDYSDEDFTDVTDRARYKRTKLAGVYSAWVAA